MSNDLGIREDDDPALEEQIRLLADRVDVPVVAPEDDLERGRGRLRRRRLGQAIGGLATAAVVGTGALWLPTVVQPAGNEVAGHRLATGSTTTPTTPPATAPATSASATSAAATSRKIAAALVKVVAAHLDPTYRHLPRHSTNTQTSTGASGEVTSVGTKLGYSDPGEQGLGMVQISVSDNAYDARWQSCQDEPAGCRRVAVPGGGTAEVRDTVEAQPDAWAVGYLRPDGLFVTVIVDPLFGNNSTVPLNDLPITQKDVLGLVADPALALIDARPEPPELRLSGAQLVHAVARALDPGGRHLRVAVTPESGGTSVTGTWDSGGQVLADTTPASESRSACLDVQFVRCSTRTVAGHEVHIGDVRPRWGGGWQVWRDGPLSTVRVIWHPPSSGASGPSVDDAATLAADTGFQQVR